MVFYAHSDPKCHPSHWHRLSDHLTATADRARHHARYFGAQGLAELAGLLHDVGKYTPSFQARLSGDTHRVDHATAGAKLCADVIPSPWFKLIAYAIAGHHTGLPNGIDAGEGRRSLSARLSLTFGRDLEALDEVWKTELTLPSLDQLLPELTPHPDARRYGFQYAFLIRMIFSCVVDADVMDTQAFYRVSETSMPAPTLEVLKQVFDAYLCDQSATRAPTRMNQLRQHIFNRVRDHAQLSPGLFTLTVPTGGGKTLTSMAFALDHAVLHGLRRVIYVIPFTSIIEQNAQVFRRAFGALGASAVLEHHSHFDGTSLDAQAESLSKQAMENWDMPIVITTAVQFFESLFSDRPFQCRKLHNITGSVIILDEAQTLPLAFLMPVIAVIDELARNYGCSLVLCTATQPALCQPDFQTGLAGVRELAPHPDALFEALNRVTITHLGALEDDTLLDRIQSFHQILIIVNHRRHAQSLFQTLRSQGVVGIFHLSSLMCAEHRLNTLDTIRERLKHHQPCRVIATSLIEAGVDLDFPCVMRAETGLDSIAQSAGRCNRERLRPKEDSHVWIFSTPQWSLPHELEVLAVGMRSVYDPFKHDLLSQPAIKAYFLTLYWRKGAQLDDHQLMTCFEDHGVELTFPFQHIANTFRVINTHRCPVLIPVNEPTRRLLEDLSQCDDARSVARKCQSYAVQLTQQDFDALVRAKAIAPLAQDRFGDQFWVLKQMDLYDPQMGMCLKTPKASHDAPVSQTIHSTDTLTDLSGGTHG